MQKVDATIMFNNISKLKTIKNMDMADFEILEVLLRKYGILSNYRMVSLNEDGFAEWPRSTQADTLPIVHSVQDGCEETIN